MPQTPNAGQSRTIDRRSGHGVKPHLQIDLCDLPIPCLACNFRQDYMILQDLQDFLIINPVNHDNPVILSKKHGSYPHLHSRAQRGRQAAAVFREASGGVVTEPPLRAIGVEPPLLFPTASLPRARGSPMSEVRRLKSFHATPRTAFPKILLAPWGGL